MTELIITPNYDKKTARFKGTIAGGESVKVTIVGAAKWLSSGLRLRVVCGCARTVAMFPLKSEDGTVSSFEVEGDDLIAAPLELNTIQARLHTQGLAATTAIFIVEDIEKNILYFQDSYELRGWVKRCGDEEPYDLTKFPGLIEDWARQIENLIVDAKEVDGGIEVTICNGISLAKTFIIRNGRDGQPGETGRKGEDGKSLKFSDLTDAQKAELKGPKGDTGEGVTDELKSLPNKVTENAQAIEANRVAINTEENRAKGAEKELLTRINDSKANAAAAMTAASKAQDTADKTIAEIATLVGDDPGDKRKSARTIAAEEVAKVVANAPADFDTLKEIAEYIESDKTGAAQMVTDIYANTKAISAEVTRATGAETELGEEIAKKVDAEEGKVLSTNDYTTAEKSKLSGIENGAQKNVAPVAPSPDGANKAADAAATHNMLAKKRDIADMREYTRDVIPAVDQWEYTDSAGETIVIPLTSKSGNTSIYSNGSSVGAYRITVDNNLSSGGNFRVGVAKYSIMGWGLVPITPETSQERIDEVRATTSPSIVFTYHYEDESESFTPTNKKLIAAEKSDEQISFETSIEANTIKARSEFLGMWIEILDLNTHGSLRAWGAPNDSSGDYMHLHTEANSDLDLPAGDVKVPRKIGEMALLYPFVDAAIVDGVVTVAPCANAKLVSDGTAFTVAVGGESGYMRDCVLVVECGDAAPTITWPANFHPRTDAETDFKCEAGVRNVYWITEHAPNEFCVAGWQETTGGNAA